MYKIDITFIALSLLAGGFCYFATNSFIFMCLVVAFYIADYFILIRRKFSYYFSLIDRVHTSYHFINSFVITLSVKESLEDAYIAATRIGNKKFNELIKGIEDNTVVDKINYLKGYFKLSIYKMFLNVFKLYEDQGGNILTMSDNLLRECTRTEKTLTETIQIGYKHLIEFIILWVMSFGILLFMRFSIKDFYNQMLQNAIVSPMIFFFFILCIVSINLFINAFVNLTIKEDLENEKNQK